MFIEGPGHGFFAIAGRNDVMPGSRECFADQFKSRWTVIATELCSWFYAF
jgi:hypothetical protein